MKYGCLRSMTLILSPSSNINISPDQPPINRSASSTTTINASNNQTIQHSGKLSTSSQDSLDKTANLPLNDICC